MVEIADDKPWSYSSSNELGARARGRELYELVRYATSSVGGQVDRTLSTFHQLRTIATERYGIRLSGKRCLEIGPGQQLALLRCFTRDNEAVGIDTDIVPQGADPRQWLEMLQMNSSMRVAKTLARKALQVDAKFARELAGGLGLKKLSTVDMKRMSATDMSFQPASFDFVYSFSVFEHIDDPKAALEEVARVMADGGLAYISLHLYTSHSGCHDPRMMRDAIPQPDYWPHLRGLDAMESAYLNKVRLPEWEEMANEIMPGCRIVLEQQESLRGPVEELRGELSDYSDDELLTVNVVIEWQKGADREAARVVRWVP
jgi:SAM-dependent methyltransferase